MMETTLLLISGVFPERD